MTYKNAEFREKLLGRSLVQIYREACEAESGKDFVHKIKICKKETKETLYWLELLIASNARFTNELNDLQEEATEFVKIFSSISSKFKT